MLPLDFIRSGAFVYGMCLGPDHAVHIISTKPIG
ncbi:hypothetical protein SAMN04515668_2791 [Hymenobacter arizonensis]|uniref:Uncharacterized protein n=1 Tax=Hymenobacter arizonensis TaxID=1227077 RepID=A0A1I5Z7Q4_HYMAR|nr:hypothetical protein SAMN04515668_2791 [Hymenobacter arizonensis]